MSLAPPVNAPPQRGSSASRLSWLRAVRGALAVACSGILLPFGAVTAAIYPLVVGSFPLRGWAPLVLALLLQWLLTWRLATPRQSPWRSWLVWLAFAAWACGTLNVNLRYFGGPVLLAARVGFWFLSTAWLFPLGWCLFRGRTAPLSWRSSIAWLLLAPLFPALFHVDQLRGDGHLLVEWRWRYVPPETPQARFGSEQALDADDAGADFAGFLGPDRSATLHGLNLDSDWSARPPQLLWRQPIAAAWSGFASAGDLAITQQQDERGESVIAFDAQTGRVRWQHRDNASFDGSGAGAGPRATPAVDRDQVFTVGATGILNCLKRGTGQLLWSRNLLADAQAVRPEHGVTGSPLVCDDLVIVAIPGTRHGPSLAAYDRRGGQLRWTSGDHPASYSSPMLARFAGTLSVLLIDQAGLNFCDPATGKGRARFEWGGNFGNRCAQPVVDPGGRPRVFLSSYECGGAVALDVRSSGDTLGVGLAWKSPALKAKFCTPVLWRNCLLGIDQGLLVCLDADSGKKLWKAGRYGEGHLLLVDDLLLVLCESGELILVQPDRRRLVELGRIQALHGKTWNAPALAHGRLYLRNDQQATCYALGLADDRQMAADPASFRTLP